MKTLLKWLISGFVAVALTGGAALAQERRAFSQQELDQMLAPIALYPDALLSQILMASTYPVEVVQAARWSRANADLAGDDAVRAVDSMDWDPSVKSLVAFPQILARMDEKLDWTERLGEAFLAQESQVMDTVQHLRRRAAATGHLGSGDYVRIVRQGDYIAIEPADPQLVFVPYYDPVVVYGAWWWPAYPPVHWAPWPGYYVRRGYASTYLWGSGIVIRIGFFFGHFDWPHRHVTVVHYHRPTVIVHEDKRVVRRPIVVPDPKPVRWQHDSRHRRSAPFRHVDPREAKTAHPAPARPDPRPDASSRSTRPQSQSAPQPPAQAVPPRRDGSPGGAGPDRSERRDANRVQALASAPRGVEGRREARRPAPTGPQQASLAQPVTATRNVTPRAQAHPSDAAPEGRARQVPQRANETAQATRNTRPPKAEGGKQKTEDNQGGNKRAQNPRAEKPVMSDE